MPVCVCVLFSLTCVSGHIGEIILQWLQLTSTNGPTYNNNNTRPRFLYFPDRITDYGAMSNRRRNPPPPPPPDIIRNMVHHFTLNTKKLGIFFSFLYTSVKRKMRTCRKTQSETVEIFLFFFLE